MIMKLYLKYLYDILKKSLTEAMSNMIATNTCDTSALEMWLIQTEMYC